MLLSLLRPSKILRFVQAVRQEGWGGALKRTRHYLAMRRAGAGRSYLPVEAGKPALDHRYLAGVWRMFAHRGAFMLDTPPARLTARPRIAVVGDVGLAQCRKYRVEQPGALWRALGVDYDFADVNDMAAATTLMQSATHLMLYRVANTPLTGMYIYEARRLGLPVLYDIDDPLFSVPAYETYGNMTALPPEMKLHFLDQAPGYAQAMNLADAVSVSTPALAEHARRFTPRPVFVRRNFADAQTLAAGAAARASADAQASQHPQDGGPFRVAFASGSMGHEVDFALIAPALETFLRAAPARRLMILGHFDPAHLSETLRAQAEIHPFTGYDDYLGHLARADCAVMPLADELFNRCKSAVRVLDAAAVSVPCLVSRVGDLPAVVAAGETGLVLDAAADWAAALEGLAQDRARTVAMGRAARARLETDWAVPDAADGDARPGGQLIDPGLIDWVRQ